jgi:hypothetical protein
VVSGKSDRSQQYVDVAGFLQMWGPPRSCLGPALGHYLSQPEDPNVDARDDEITSHLAGRSTYHDVVVPVSVADTLPRCGSSAIHGKGRFSLSTE